MIIVMKLGNYISGQIFSLLSFFIVLIIHLLGEEIERLDLN